jgi:hypothetical protein
MLFARQMGENREAESLFKDLVHAVPRNAAGFNLLAISLTEAGKACGSGGLHSTRVEGGSLVLQLWNWALSRPSEVLERFNLASTIGPKVVEEWNNRGATLNDLR